MALAGVFFYAAISFNWINFAKSVDCTKVPTAENAVTISMENNSFVPSEVTANVCDTLLFINLDDKEKQPSISQEGLAAFPDFKAEFPLKKYEFFQYQVTKTGTYSFYDIQNESATGKIIIKDIK